MSRISDTHKSIYEYRRDTKGQKLRHSFGREVLAFCRKNKIKYYHCIIRCSCDTVCIYPTYVLDIIRDKGNLKVSRTYCAKETKDNGIE